MRGQGNDNGANIKGKKYRSTKTHFRLKPARILCTLCGTQPKFGGV